MKHLQTRVRACHDSYSFINLACSYESRVYHASDSAYGASRLFDQLFVKDLEDVLLNIKSESA